MLDNIIVLKSINSVKINYKIKKAKENGKQTIQLLSELTHIRPEKNTKTYCIDRKK